MSDPDTCSSCGYRVCRCEDGLLVRLGEAAIALGGVLFALVVYAIAS